MGSRAAGVPDKSRSVSLAVLALLVASCDKQRPLMPTLTCHVQYADTFHDFAIEPAANPYAVPLVPIEGRFEFRAIYVTQPADLAGLNVYVYQTSAGRHALVHQLKLEPPYLSGSHRYGVTGLNVVYDERARELQYWCGFAAAAGAP